MKLKKILIVGLSGILAFSMGACDDDYGDDDDSGITTPTPTPTPSGVDRSIFGAKQIAPGTQRVALAQDAEGRVPIETNTNTEVYIDNRRVTEEIVRDDGFVVVDVPLGGYLEIRFVPAVDQIGTISPVYCLYPNPSSDVIVVEYVFAGGVSPAPGVPPYVCPLDVATNGSVGLSQAPTNTGLRIRLRVQNIENTGSYYNSYNDSTNGNIPGFGEGSIIRVAVAGDGIDTSIGTLPETIRNVINFNGEFPTYLNFDSDVGGNNYDLHLDWIDQLGGVWSARYGSDIYVEGTFDVISDFN